MDSSGYNERDGKLPKEIGSRFVHKAPKLRNTTESRSEQIGVEKPVETILGEAFARVLWS